MTLRKPGPALLVATFCLLSLIWGSTWAGIRVSLQGIPPLSGVALRFAIGGALLLALALRSGVPLGKRPHEKTLWAINTVFAFCISYGIVYWAEQWVPSGLASVLFATFPLFVGVLGHFLLPAERLQVRSTLGIVLAFLGVAVIFSEDFSLLGGPMVAVAGFVLLVSPVSAAFASVAVKRWGTGVHPLSITAVPMLATAVLMGIVAAVVEHDAEFRLDPLTVGVTLYLAIFGSAVTFSLFYWLLSHVEASRAALIAYTTPVVAVAIGALALDEPVTPRVLAGSALVLLGVAMAVTLRRVVTPETEAEARSR